MKIRGDKLEQLAGARGVSIEQLAQAIERVGLKGDKAQSAVGNWIRGADHPRCKAADAQKLAGAVGAAVKDIVRFTSTLNGHRGSPRKAALLVDLIRGKTVDQAQHMLSFTTKRAAVDIKKVLDAAVSDAEQFEADVTNLVVAESRCDHGLRMKRFQPKDRGRAHPIIKRFANITIGVQERSK